MHPPSRISPAPRALFALIALALSAAEPPQSQLSAKWLGQDGHDLVGGKPGPSKSDYQDIHFAVRGIPANRKVVETIVRGFGGGEWKSSSKDNFSALLVRKGMATSGDVYVEPYQRESGREFEIHLIYDNGVEQVAGFAGGKADPNRRAPGAGIEAKWAGQDGQDRTGTSPNPGPDGSEDAHLSLTRLSAKPEIKAVAIEGPGGLAWAVGHNPKGHPAAELARSADDRTRAELYFAPGVDLAGKSLQVTVTYGDDRTDVTSVAAGKCNPAKPAARTPATAPAPGTATSTAKWLGQDGVEINPGDVHVALEGLAPGRSIVAAALSDSVVGTWVFKSGEKVKFDAGQVTDRLHVRRISPTRGDLVFPPIRDESGATMTLRLLDQSGREEVIRFPGGKAEIDRRAPPLPPGAVTAKPGDDLNDLAGKYGTIRLAKGIYPLSRPLVLVRPTRISGEAGATLQFAQAPGEPKWTAAIKVHAGGTTLEGFAVRFAGPVRWDQEVSFGPAVIGTTDDRDHVPHDPKFKLHLSRLDLEGPPPSADWEEATHLIRVISALSGRIERNTLRGGSVVFTNGPWSIAENLYKGTPPKTLCNGAFAGRYTHDVIISGNKARPEGPSGKTWRFLVLTQRGMSDTVRGNVVEGGIGPREDDPKPHPNAPEVMLTEAYRLHFEGKPASISADGRLLTIPTPQGGGASTGDAVAILSGPEAGQWRTVAQALGSQSYLLDEPISKNTDAVSIATGFVRETFEANTVDCRGSGIAADLVLAGNLFGVRVINNRFLGGGESIRLLATPTEEPVHWGWSHAPFLGGVFRGNTLEDAPGGGIGVEHGSEIRSNRGRVYMTLDFQDNTLRWTRSTAKPPRLRFGFGPSIDPRELVLTEGGTVVEGAPPEAAWVHAATVNGRVVQEAPLKSAGNAGAPEPARRK